MIVGCRDPLRSPIFQPLPSSSPRFEATPSRPTYRPPERASDQRGVGDLGQWAGEPPKWLVESS